MKIISSGKINAKVLLGKNPSSQELFAAEELEKYLKKISNSSENAENTENVIIVGGPAKNEYAKEFISEDEFSKFVPGREGIAIMSLDEKTLLIAGSNGDSDRGTIYAVYEFLERFCGCSLAAYSHPDIDAGELVPKTDELSLENVKYIKEGASRIRRGACVQFGDKAGDANHELNITFFDFLVKNRYNLFSTWARVYNIMKEKGLIAELNRRGIEVEVGHHDSSDLFMPADGNEYFPEKYYETHPEFFKLLEDGTRYHSVDHRGQMIFCYRNLELVEEFSKNIIKWLADNPDVVYVSLPPHDGRAPQCCCPMCTPYTKTENYAEFINEVAKRVGAVYPKVKIGLAVYVDIWECPDNLKLSPSVMVWEATWKDPHRGLRSVGKPDGSCLNGTHFEENLLKWKETGAEISYYDYYMGVYQERQRYIPMADEIQAIWKRFIENDVIGGTTQIECFHLWNYIFNFYTYGRTAYDVSLSMDDNLRRFTKIFGEGAEFIAEAIRTAEACMDGQVLLQYCGVYFAENIDKEHMYNCFEKAFEAASTPFFRNNIRLLRMAFRYTDLETQEENAESLEYQKVRIYENINPELLYMTRFDSFWKNNPGYGIAIPVDGDTDEIFEPNKWYLFE